MLLLLLSVRGGTSNISSSSRLVNYTIKTNSLLCVGIVSNLVDRAPFPHILVANGSDYSTK